MVTSSKYYDWLARDHGISVQTGVYEYVFYDYYPGDELLLNNIVFKDSRYVTLDNTHVRLLNKTDMHMYDTSDIKIYDSGTLSMYTSAMTLSAGTTTSTTVTELTSNMSSLTADIESWSVLLYPITAELTGEYTNVLSITSVHDEADLNYIMSTYDSPTAVETSGEFLGVSVTAVTGITDYIPITAVSGYQDVTYYDTPTVGFSRSFTVDNKGRVGIGLKHETPHGSPIEQPMHDLDVRGSVGVNNYIHHNDDVGTFMLFGSVSTVSGVAVSGTHFQTVSGEPQMDEENDKAEINFVAGGIEMIHMSTSATSGSVVINPGNHDVTLDVNGTLNIDGESLTKSDLISFKSNDTLPLPSAPVRKTSTLTQNISSDEIVFSSLQGVGPAYVLFKIETSHAAWVRLYTDSTTMQYDLRTVPEDPLIPAYKPITEVTTGSGYSMIRMLPAVVGFNDDSPVSDTCYIAVKNLESTAQSIDIKLTYLNIEA